MLQVSSRSKEGSVGNPDVQNQWRKRRRKRRRKAPNGTQQQRVESGGSEHGTMEPRCAKRREEEEEEEEEGSNHGTKANGRALGLRASHNGTQMCKTNAGRGGGRGRGK